MSSQTRSIIQDNLLQRKEVSFPTNQHRHQNSEILKRPSSETVHSDVSSLSGENGTLGQRFPNNHVRFDGILRKFWLRNKGVIYVLLAQFFGACMNLATRILESPGSHGDGMHPFQLLFVRMFATLVFSTIYMWYTAVPDFLFGARQIRYLLLLRGFSGFFVIFGLYFSLMYLPLAEAIVLTFLGPMLSCYLYSFLRPEEPFTRLHQIGAYVSIVGVLFIAHPTSLFSSSSTSTPTSEPMLSPNTTTIIDDAPSPATQALSVPLAPTTAQRTLAIGLSLVGVLGGAVALTTIRYIGKRAHPLISTNYFATWCTIVSLFSFVLVPGVHFKLPENPTEWALLLFLGINGFAAQVLQTAGMAYATSEGRDRPTMSQRDIDDAIRTKSIGATNPAGTSGGSRATSMIYTQMLFALLFDKLIWDESPIIWSWIGSGLILGSVVWVSIANDTNTEKLKQLGTSTTLTNPGVVDDENEMRLEVLEMGVIGKSGEERYELMKLSEEADNDDEYHDDDDGDDKRDMIRKDAGIPSTLQTGGTASSNSG